MWRQLFSECNGFVSVTGNSNHNPSIRAGIYKDLGKFFAFNRKSTETLPDFLKLDNLQKAMPSKHIVFTEASTTSLSFDRAEVWNLFLIAMLLFLIAESVFGYPLQTFLQIKMNKGLSLDSWQIEWRNQHLVYSKLMCAFCFMGMQTWIRMKKIAKLLFGKFFVFLLFSCLL